MYYTALTTSHGGPIPPKRNSIGRAVWRRHGFASLDAGGEVARVETVSLRLTSPRLVLNVSAKEGSVRVALLEADGSPIPGFSLKESNELREDATQWEVTWHGGASIPTDRAVRILIEMKQAQLFSVCTTPKHK
jgi:hypothetical protein